MILAIETSTTHASLVLADSVRGESCEEAFFISDRAHNTAIFSPLERMLQGRRESLTQLLVGVGPGSYGGIRVGIAVAQGLSLALGIPVCGMSSLVAWEGAGDSYIVLGDARRGSVFLAEVRERRFPGEPMLIPAEEVESALAPFREEGISLVTADESVARGREGVTLSWPRAHHLVEAFLREGEAAHHQQGPLAPHYLRAPHITTPKRKPPPPLD